LKATSPYFSPAARAEGLYKGKLRPFCLPLENAEENLFSEIRQKAVSVFADHRIKWHDGQNGTPSNHLCDSQVCCVNFLLSFADRPTALAQLLRPVYPHLRQILALDDGQYVTFEWIGQKNYLGERIRGRDQRVGEPDHRPRGRLRAVEFHPQVVDLLARLPRDHDRRAQRRRHTGRDLPPVDRAGVGASLFLSTENRAS